MLISAAQVAPVAYYWILAWSDAHLAVALSGLFIMTILFALPLSDYLTRQFGGL